MKDAQYKQVVIVGNGPSAITLSWILAGNQPWLTAGPVAHPDEFLDVRIRGQLASAAGAVTSDHSVSAPLLQCDLQALATGLEGRSRHPLALLMDALCHPGADLGHELPAMLQWRYDSATVKDHIVLGHGPPGGSWQAMDGNVLTISLASWMELPALDLKTWQARTQKAHGHAHGDGHDGQEQGLLHEGRASVAAVAQYYSDYVQLQGLSKYFRSGVSVTSISPVPASKLRHWWRTKRCCRERDMKPLWRVDGVDLATGDQVHYVTPHVVLATGGTDQRNRLGVPGELTVPDQPSPFGDNRIVHDLRSFEEAVANLAQEADDVTNLDPVLIVGAGLSAADAVIAARFHSLPVLHVFRNRSVPADRQLPENMYPEYHKVHQMMGDGGASYPLYRSLPEHHVVDLTGMHSDGKVVIEGADGSRTAHRVSLVAILIGSRPDLSPIRPACSGGDGLGLGVNPSAPVDCRSNPIDVDPWSYEVKRAPQRGLYSLGPISGDTFVRFVQGGSLGIAASISASAKTNS